jgi:hypothetical protein
MVWSLNVAGRTAGNYYLGGVGGFIAEQVEKMTGMEVRYVALRHLQRRNTHSL